MNLPEPIDHFGSSVGLGARTSESHHVARHQLPRSPTHAEFHRSNRSTSAVKKRYYAEGAEEPSAAAAVACDVPSERS
ncbi:unnamed protein product [Lampetra planeri]